MKTTRENIKWHLEINTKGIIEKKLFTNSRGLLIYIHEHLQERYINYETKWYHKYQMFRRKINELEIGEKKINHVENTQIIVTKIIEHQAYEGKKGNEHIKESIL